LGAVKRIIAACVILLALLDGAYAAGEQVLRFGMSAAFSGPSRELGIELYRGVSAYFDSVNAHGGVFGRRLELLALDDGYNPLPAISNTITFIDRDDVFALFSYVGTPTVTRILPLLTKYRQRNIPLLFPFTGAEPIRRPPYLDSVYNLRASYAQETRSIVDRCVALGRKRVGIFYQADAFGRGGWAGVRSALKEHGLDAVQDASYPRGSGVQYAYTEQARLLHEAGVDVVVCIGTCASSAGFIRDFRALGDKALVACISFANGDELSRVLSAMQGKQEAELSRNLLLMQVVPSYEDTSLPAVREYRLLMGAYARPLPPNLLRGNYIPRRFSAVSFEGYLNARLLVELLRRLGPEPERSAITRAMAEMTLLDIGLDVPVRFGDRQQGLDSVYFMTVDDGAYVPVKDWARWRL